MQATRPDGSPLAPSSLNADGGPVKAWEVSSQQPELLFRPVQAIAIPQDAALYLAVTCLDDRYGRIRVTFPGKEGNSTQPDRVLRGTLEKTGATRTAYFRLPRAREEKHSGPQPVVRISSDRAETDGLAILKVALQDQPFDDPQFRSLLTTPWLAPYAGPTVKPADNSTLKGKIMTGYQGWFRTPNDPYARGWVHWGDIPNKQFTVDMWPDVSQYPPRVLEKAADVKTTSGKTASLFSSAWPEVTDLHFRWMRENNIDGAFLQRFVSNDFCSMSGKPEWVLANVRAAANQQGRIWAVEYDVSGYPDAKILDTLRKDWAWMVDTFQIGKDSNYARVDGKLVVFIWGLAFPDRNFTQPTANAVVDFFKSDPKYGGNYVMGGIPNWWRRMDAGWKEHFKKYDAVQPWMSTSYAEDIQDFARLGVTYYPHAKPGFSWANLMHIQTGSKQAYEPREGGRFYWNLLQKAAQAGVDRLFIGMFDEYDEGTAIMPFSQDPPPTPSRDGLTAIFYNNKNWSGNGRKVERSSLEYDFRDAVPVRGMPSTEFTQRWSGQIIPPATGDYTLFVEGCPGDSATLQIHDKNLIQAKPFVAGQTYSGNVTAKSGEGLIFRLDYSHESAAGKLTLLWEGPGISRRPVPPEAFRDAWGRFVTPEGQPSDWWLTLTRYGKEMILHQRPANSPMPEPSLSK